MTNEWGHAVNDGSMSVDYQLLDDPDRNAHLSFVLNQACHVFHCHADGSWASQYKDNYAKSVAKEIARFPSLTHRLLGVGDRVIKMVAYRALELLEAGGPLDGPLDESPN